MNKVKLKGIIYLLITAIIWGGAFISQFIGGTAIGSFSFNAYRSVFGCIAISIMIYCDSYSKTGKFVFFREEEDKILTIKNSIWCGFFLFLALITQQIGVEMTDSAKAGIIASTEVVCVPVILFIFYKRKIHFLTWIFIFFTMFGVMLLSANSISGINQGDIWVFASTILYSITIIQIPKYIKTTDPLKFSFFRFVIVGICSFICMIIAKEDAFNTIKLRKSIFSILYSGILASGVAYTFQILGQRYCEPVIATLIMSLEGIFAAIFGWIILSQKLNAIQVIGIVIAFASIVFVQLLDSDRVV